MSVPPAPAGAAATGPSPAPRWASLGLVLLTVAGAAALTALLTPSRGLAWRADDPAARVARPRTHTDHRGLFPAPLPDGPSVTRACLECHPTAAREVMGTQHYQWLGHEHAVPGRGPGHAAPTRIGKKNTINNFCLSVESNWPRCTSCHAGYGWADATYDFEDPALVDCLVCHEQTGAYRKDLAGLPAEGTDLRAAAESGGRPTRANCGACHFAGGGGDAVKHGDLDATLTNPPANLDVHMGRANLACVDCHRTEHHQVPGQSMGVSTGAGQRVACTDCHAARPHRTERLNQHAGPIACVTCHVPLMAVETPTKMVWDWSTAGQDTQAQDPHRYLKEKGSFVYASRVVPEYAWFDGRMERYLKGDPVDPNRTLDVNRPLGTIGDPRSQIWPFKVHRGKQPYDTRLRHLLVAKTWGEGGYWTEFDWRRALTLGSAAAGIPFSGEYGFIQTRMYWPQAHMIPPAGEALGCVDCHSEQGRLDWRALGYEGDPALRGGRARLGYVGEGEG